MKSDVSVFGGYYLGLIIGVLGTLLGLIFLFGKQIVLGVIVIIISLAVGKFLVFKARRRKGHIIYDGGKI